MSEDDDYSSEYSEEDWGSFDEDDGDWYSECSYEYDYSSEEEWEWEDYSDDWELSDDEDDEVHAYDTWVDGIDDEEWIQSSAQGAANLAAFASTSITQVVPNPYAVHPGQATAQLHQNEPPPPSGQRRPRIALLIGINYPGSDAELHGCGNDAALLYRHLTKSSALGFRKDEIIFLTDDESAASRVKRPMKKPTKKNIEAAFLYIREFCMKNPHSLVWFSYSGHGSSIEDENGDERDGMDECICTCDDGFILDDWLYGSFLAKLPPTASVFALMDCCHSGTILDLKFFWNADRCESEHDRDPLRATVTMISGCRDSQTSSDAYDDAEQMPAGALTSAFLTVWKKGLCTGVGMIKSLHKLLEQRGFDQRPRLTSSRPIKDSTPFPVGLWEKKYS